MREKGAEATMMIKFSNIEELCSILNIKEDDFRMAHSCEEIRYIKHRTETKRRYVTGWDYILHNLLNKTYGKKDVPTIYTGIDSLPKSMYCTNCKSNHAEIDVKGRISFFSKIVFSIDVDEITCKKCNTVYDTRDVKLLAQFYHEVVCGDIFIDENKISISQKYVQNILKKDGTFYYDDGYVRVTFNTKTGYTYTTNKGHAYKSLQRSQGNNPPPYMYNSTYTIEDHSEDLIDAIAHIKVIEKYKKLDAKELITVSTRAFDDTKKAYRHEILKKLSLAMHEQIQSNFDYKIPTLREYYDMHTTTFDAAINSKLIRIFKIYNRFVNINPFESATWILTNQFYGLQCQKLHREEVNIISALYKVNKVKIGKKTRAFTQQENYNSNLLTSVAAYGIAFKNPDNIYKFLKAYQNYNTYAYSSNIETIKLWLKYRSENYVVKELISGLNNAKSAKKEIAMRDAAHMIEDIKEAISYFDIDKIVTFKNEKQFHDDVLRYYNSEEYFMLANEELYKKEFELEKEVLALEKPEENIFISTNRGQLSEIGRKMSICVGSYSDSVEKGYCRIAYVVDKDSEGNKDYIACVELKPTIENNKYIYSIVQAKLKYNRLVCTDENIYNKIYTWAIENNINIDTVDMKRSENRQYA